jgi:L-lactate dehydrogenase (cytochrome)
LLARAGHVGCRTLLFTVDLPVAGLRHRDTRQGLMDGGLYSRLARGCQILSRPAWVWDVGVRGKPHRFGNLADRVPNPDDLDAFKRWLDAQFDPRTSWDDIRWLRDTWQGTLLLKGVQEVEDGEQAACLGVDGLVVSNHGGRQLDSVASSIRKLPAMVDAVGHRLDVFMDGGVRSGIDVFKAVALGAKGVLIGRPWAWALAAQGQGGVQALLSTFANEFRVAMALTGVNTVAEIGRAHLDGDIGEG